MAGLTEELHDEAAERYAHAAFDLALEGAGVDAIDRDLQTVAAAFAESADLRAVAKSPMIAVDEKTRAFVAIAEKLGLSPLGRKIVGLVVQNGRAKELPQIAKAYHARLALYKGLQQVEIISAAPLEAAQREALLASLKRTLGGEIEAQERIDPRLIGGFVVRAGSRQFDTSIRSKLDGLKLALQNA